jgi:hypothetical protein
MKEHATNDAITRHLLKAIERVRVDVERVEFWADAMAGFAQPVPEYKPEDASVWLPAEQAAKLRTNSAAPDAGAQAKDGEADRKERERARG